MSTLLKYLTFMGYLFSLSATVFADVEPRTVELSVKPQKCVSLHKGQTCYQKLKFQWDNTGTKVCLFNIKGTKPLHCTMRSGTIEFRYSFESTKEQTFTLRDADGNALSSVDIEVASVYKGKRRATTGWRLF